MDRTEQLLRISVAAVAAGILSQLLYRLALEVWCVAYGVIY